MITLPLLFGIFFYVGLFTIGGGLAAITLMQQQIVERDLITPEVFYNMVAVSESTPGPIGINMSTYIGCKLYGVWGGVITTFATVLPSLIIIIIIAKYFGKFQDKPLVKSVFSGLRPGVTGMIAVAAWNVMEIAVIDIPSFLATRNIKDLFDIKSVVFYFLAVFTLFKTKLHPVAVIAAGAVFGILFM